MTQNMPAAEVTIDESLVRRLLADQRPDLVDRDLSILAFGWDNVSIRIGTDLVARLPRRSLAVDLISNEAKWMPVIAADLPLPVPVPSFVGAPGAGYPWPWSISALIPGTSVALTTELDLEASARILGGFLHALHHPAPSNAPDNPFRGGPLGDRERVTRDRLETVGHIVDLSPLELLWERAIASEPHPTDHPIWLHGDLHPANLLQEDGVICGVVDFGDMTGGDPATDLAIGWSLFTSGTRVLLWESYGGLLEPTIDRARGWAISLGAAYLAHSDDNPTMAAIGRRTLAEVAADI